MKAQELIQKMKDGGCNETASILERRTRRNNTSIFISDIDNEAYKCENGVSLVGWLMQNCTWSNSVRNGFTAHLK